MCLVPWEKGDRCILPPSGPSGASHKMCFAGKDALDDELKSFISAVRNRQAPEVTGQMGRDALKIALNIMDQINATSGKLLGRG